MERSTMRMHACILASDPPLRYQKGALDVMDRIEGLRRQGIGVVHDGRWTACKDTLQRIRCAESLCSTQRFCTRKRPSSGLSWTRYNPLTVVKLRAPGKGDSLWRIRRTRRPQSTCCRRRSYAQPRSHRGEQPASRSKLLQSDAMNRSRISTNFPLPMHFAKDRI